MDTVTVEQFKKLQGDHKPFKARPRPVPGTMNKTERAYADVLELARRAGELQWWAFEPIKLRLAPKTFYTPDFAALRSDGQLMFIEVKGHWEDDARVKIKVAAEKFWMFHFVAIRKQTKKEGGGWAEERF